MGMVGVLQDAALARMATMVRLVSSRTALTRSSTSILTLLIRSTSITAPCMASALIPFVNAKKAIMGQIAAFKSARMTALILRRRLSVSA